MFADIPQCPFQAFEAKGSVITFPVSFAGCLFRLDLVSDLFLRTYLVLAFSREPNRRFTRQASLGGTPQGYDICNDSMTKEFAAVQNIVKHDLQFPVHLIGT